MSKLILIAGGTASGKTTLVNRIKDEIGIENVSIVSMDNYYRSHDDVSLEQKKDFNFDHPSAIDFQLMKKNIKKLLLGKSINSPLYDFRIHSRLNETELIEPKKIIIIEGIFGLYDEALRKISNLNIYVEADSDIRFIRRLKRDVVERARTIDTVVMQYINTVKPMHDLYINKTKQYADIIIDSTYDSTKQVKELVNTIKDLMK